jgi:hypothetical protein
MTENACEVFDVVTSTIDSLGSRHLALEINEFLMFIFGTKYLQDLK